MTLRIGNQTAYSAARPWDPFDFALYHRFDCFEWFSDRKEHHGRWRGWDENEVDGDGRADLRRVGRERGILYTVHAPWQANPLYEQALPLFRRSIDFARDVGASLVNLHLYTDAGPDGYARGLLPVLRMAADVGVRIAIENTVHTTPDDVNAAFAALRAADGSLAKHAGFCLDIGHANLCHETRCDYIRYLDRIQPEVPLDHLHVHENFGDADTHLTLFTGPSAHDTHGVRLLLERLRDRRYSGGIILEQWPRPAELLCEARARLLSMWNEIQPRGAAEAAPPPPPPPAPEPPVAVEAPAVDNDAPLVSQLVAAHGRHRSWRGRLQWVRDWLARAGYTPTQDDLVALSIYLRFLSTGELRCEEDGGHYRPNHHAEAAMQIEGALERATRPETAWLVRRIYPLLPSWGEEFRRGEPLTRIRDIAHRNDIPRELKVEIKHRLQNKLHRCAGPEDLRTSAELLARITAPDAGVPPEFVSEFKVFHDELREFFNAGAVEKRLAALARELEAAGAGAELKAFLDLKNRAPLAPSEVLELLGRLVALRRRVGALADAPDAWTRSRARLTALSMEDYAFALLSEAAIHLEGFDTRDAWPDLFRALQAAVENVRLGGTESEECALVLSELSAWSKGFQSSDSFHLLRLRATLERARRLTESYTDRLLALLPPRVEELGRALGVSGHAVRVFSEAEVRANVVFQLSKLAGLGLKAVRRALLLPPWEAIVPGDIPGQVVCAGVLGEVNDQPGPLLVLLEKAEGDEEIPAGVKGIALAHPIPHLSHLGVRARQGRVAFAACDDEMLFRSLSVLAGKSMRMRVTPEGLEFKECGETELATAHAAPGTLQLPQAQLANSAVLVDVAEATAERCGAKAVGARRLVELARRSSGLFTAPGGVVIPFGVQECSGGSVPPALVTDILSRFPPGTRLAVRSSANGEDLPEMAGAGLYESVIGVTPEGLPDAILTVWRSLFTERAVASRRQAGIPDDAIRMAVLIQPLIEPAASFIMHTVDPLSGSHDEACVELAVGLGEILAAASEPGTPYRLLCHRHGEDTRVRACASFSVALRPGEAGRIKAEPLDYSRVAYSANSTSLNELGGRLGRLAGFLEHQLGRPQDIEGVILSSGAIVLVQTRPQQGL